jgi:hypothetical protein
MLTEHAIQRQRERAPGIDLIALWNAGRDAAAADLAGFRNSWPRPGVQYRIAVRNRCTYLIARDKQTGNFITVIRK